jgi:hypothetical protein
MLVAVGMVRNKVVFCDALGPDLTARFAFVTCTVVHIGSEVARLYRAGQTGRRTKSHLFKERCHNARASCHGSCRTETTEAGENNLRVFFDRSVRTGA